MLRRGWRSQPAKKGKRRAFLIAMLIFLLFSLQSFIYIEKNLRPPLMHVAKLRIKQIATQAINTAISERIAHDTSFSQLMDLQTDKNGKVSYMMLNYAEHMRIASRSVDVVQNLLNELREIPEHIPVGQAMNSAILASFGPKVPVKFTPLGAVKVNLGRREEHLGINMVLVEVYIRITAEVAIIIPFDTESEVVETEIPLSYVVMSGDVPMYYYDGNGNPVSKSSAAPPGIAIPQIKAEDKTQGAAPGADKSGSATTDKKSS